MESYQEINRRIRRIFKIRNQPVAPFMGGYQSSRIDLAKLFGTLEYKIGAEIGVSKGLYSKELCKAIDDLKLFLIDPWAAYDQPSISDERAKARYESCLERLEPYNVEYMRMTSMEAVRSFDDNSLDFVYIDGLHTFDAVMSDLIFWSPKVRPGGIVAGHDYLEFPQSGIIPAVRTYVTCHGIHDWYVTRDKDPSFFWVRGERL
jgi:hypothetical protein